MMKRVDKSEGKQPRSSSGGFRRIHGKVVSRGTPSLVATVEEKHPDPGTHRFPEEDKGGTESNCQILSAGMSRILVNNIESQVDM